MHKTWFRHHDLTTAEADELIHRYTLRNVKTEKTLSADPRYWVVLALLPEGRTEPRVDKIYQQRCWQ
ncbi:hypothetical protein A936_09003 [Enterobacter sp. Ag1]|nr:hypothetical protein A936_09003 [Enterobacter sp. Ag1]